jgi:prepilin-type N-terminal cleavage/methylation domain-containing protein
MISARSRPDDGFTLVEVLVALSVIALMSGLMLAMMGQFRHLTYADHRLTDQTALKKTANHIAGLLERAEALPLEITPGAPLVFMAAQEGGARFLAVAKSGALTSGLLQIEINLEKKDGIERVVETISPRSASDQAAGKATFELLGHAERLTFSYLHTAEAPEHEPVWSAEWKTAGELPVAIRVTIQTRDKSGDPLSASSIAYLSR